VPPRRGRRRRRVRAGNGGARALNRLLPPLLHAAFLECERHGRVRILRYCNSYLKINHSLILRVLC
jgi:hypothetical protein